MRLSARVDYALRAVAELAAQSSALVGDAGPDTGRGRAGALRTGARRLVTAEQIARAQEIPPKFLESILLQLRRGGVVQAQRGPEGGYWLARPAEQISLADVIRVIDGPLANVRGQRPEELGYRGAARSLRDVWIALRANERQILELVTVADVAAGTLPSRVTELTADPEAWV
ncbi:RrF2 family transcriptional regulator [Plantactinospora sp. GCM10030261]|uniref:RrF2 family transcriptional regulator n=1 Tax=Plantactinospora sp. GCM10030261 TaxID=3273420 RepID=UPI0036211BB3